VWFCRWLKSFLWEANGGSPRYTGKLFIWSRSGRYRPNIWIVSWSCWRRSKCVLSYRPLCCELLRGEYLMSTITSMGEVVSVPPWPITQIFLSCIRAWLRAWCHVAWDVVVELECPSKLWLGMQRTIRWWWMNLFRGLLELSVLAPWISSIIIWCFQIGHRVLLWATQPPSWRSIGCLQWRSIQWHHMWTKDGGKQIVNSIRDLE